MEGPHAASCRSDAARRLLLAGLVVGLTAAVWLKSPGSRGAGRFRGASPSHAKVVTAAGRHAHPDAHAPTAAGPHGHAERARVAVTAASLTRATSITAGASPNRQSVATALATGADHQVGHDANGFTSAGANCNCGARIALYKTGSTTPEACNRKCTAKGKKCQSFGVWTGGKAWLVGMCVLFDAACLPDGSCADPTAVSSGYTNRVYNVAAAAAAAGGDARAIPMTSNRTAAAATAAATRCGKHANERFDHTPYDTDPCCTPEGRRCGWSHATDRDKPNSAIPDCERKNLVSILEWFQKVVTVDWFVGDGTLLGAVRDGAFRPADTDIDLFMDAAHAGIAREEVEEALGCTHFGFSHTTRPWRLAFSATNEVRVSCALSSHAWLCTHYSSSGGTSQAARVHCHCQHQFDTLSEPAHDD